MASRWKRAGVVAGILYLACWVSSSLGIFYFQIEETDVYESSPPTVSIAGIQVGAFAHGLRLPDRTLWYAPLIRVGGEGRKVLVAVYLYDRSRHAVRYRVRAARAVSRSDDRAIPLALFARYRTGDCVPPGSWGRFWRTSGYAGHIRPEPDWMGVLEHGYACDTQRAPRPDVRSLGDRFRVVLDLSVEGSSGPHEGSVRLEMVRRRESRVRAYTLLDTLSSLG